MAIVVRQHWTGQQDRALTRRDRQSCDYEAYVPDTVAGWSVMFDGDVAADVTDAERALTRLDAEAAALVDTEALARLLLRTESIASSRIEGLEVGGRRLLRVAAAVELGEPPRDLTATEVLRNIDAMLWGVTSIEPGEQITVEHLLEVHRRLLTGTPLEAFGGHVRKTQNWIGGSDHHPCAAAFVPPPPEHVAPLLQDLCVFCNADAIPAVAQAAIAHAQFETIHPFADGNGRTGRVLIHLVLRRRGLTTRVVPPISLVLASRVRDYVAGLTGTRYRGPAASRQAHEAWNRWVGLIAVSCTQAVADAEAFERRARELQQSWRARAGQPRGGSAPDRLIDALPGAPVVTAASAAELTGRSVQAANQAIARLVEAGILRQINVGRRNRAFETPEVIEAFTELERQITSPPPGV